MAENPGDIGWMGFIQQFDQAVHGVTPVQASDGIKKHHPFPADKLSFELCFHET
jgi:hypothetical protein